MTSRHLVLLHGFTQSGAIWAGIADELAARLGPGTTISAPDLPGHGPGADRSMSLPATADHLAATLTPGIVIGYSMGGRIALHLALAHPATVEALVVIGVDPGIESDTARRDRRRADEALADEIERIGVEAFLTRWLAQPLFAGLTVDEADLTARRVNTAAGLAASLRAAGVGTQMPLWDRLGEIRCPTLVIAGEHDAKYSAIAERVAPLIPDAAVAIIAGAGHAAHLERRHDTVTVIAEWIDTLDLGVSRGR